MSWFNRFAVILIVIVFTQCAIALAEDWPQWRGPRGDGTSQESELPIAWNQTVGILWSTPLPEWGSSTPAIWGDALFLTTNTPEKLLLLRINKQSGAIEWSRKVAAAEAVRVLPPKPDTTDRGEQKFHESQNLATPSPVTDGKVVVVHFGNGDLAAYNFAGKQIWKRNLQSDHGKYTIWCGHANSPVIVGDLVISVCMQDSLADLQPNKLASYVVAHDLQTGRERWKTDRRTKADAEECDSYTTPLLANIGGQQQLIVMGANQLDAYDPTTGKQLWYLPKLVGGRLVTGPIVADGFIIATRGIRGATIAVSLDTVAKAKSPELDFHDIAWKYEQGTPDSCSPVAWGNWLFMVTDDGIARCFEIATGNLKWKGRLKGDYKASPVAGEGRVYFLSTSGTCTVVAASDRFEKLAENEIADTFFASPAISDGRIYLRGRKALYCVGK